MNESSILHKNTEIANSNFQIDPSFTQLNARLFLIRMSWGKHAKMQRGFFRSDEKQITKNYYAAAAMI